MSIPYLTFQSYFHRLGSILLAGLLAGCSSLTDVSAPAGKTTVLATRTTSVNETSIVTKVMPSPSVTGVFSPPVTAHAVGIPLYPTFSPTFTPAPSDLSGSIVFDDLVDKVTFESQIFLANLDTVAIQQLTFIGSNDSPIWSPDGKKLALVSDQTGNLALLKGQMAPISLFKFLS